MRLGQESSPRSLPWFLWVGAGSVYAGQLGIGILWFCAAVVAWILCVSFIGFLLVPSSTSAP
jgi:hypothetical protein